MKRIPWEDLKDTSQKRGPRTSREVLREYEEKYGALLKMAEDLEGPPPELLETVRWKEVGDAPAQMSIGDSFFETTTAKAMEASLHMHIDEIGNVALGRAASIVDLGCGYGYLLSRLRPLLGREVELRGGEISPVAIELAKRLHGWDPNLTVESFDFHAARCPPLGKAAAPCVVVTAFALHQLPTAASAAKLLYRYRDKVEAVVTLEPEEDLFGSAGGVGDMRRRYQRAHDYSADLLRCLGNDVVIDKLMANAVGANALLPGTLTVWRFR